MDLAPHALHPEIWRYLLAPFNTVADVQVWVDQALVDQQRGDALPFVIRDRKSGEAIGSTRVFDIRREHRGVEIGNTWLGRSWWRTHVNSEAKYLVLRHLFEEANCIRVCLQTDALNTRSQRAIERLGAQRDGVLRKHKIVVAGRIRDSVFYSIIDDEWAAIRTQMERGLYGHHEA